MLDKDRLLAGLAAFVVSVIWCASALVPVIFADPPPARPTLVRACIEKALAAASAFAAGLLSAPWAADFVNQAVAKYLGLPLQVDTLSAGVAVGVVVAILVADPTARVRLTGWVSRKFEGVLK
jgi:hypothetical protein